MVQRFSPRRVLPLGASAVVALAFAAAVGQSAAQSPAAAAPAPSLSSTVGANVTELKKIDSKQGAGAEAVAGKVVIVHYTGWLYDPNVPDGHGKKFDSSVDRGQPFDFPLGGGRVIKGWDEGVAGMKVGGKRTLVIPPAMGYGARGAGGVIPPNATLVFDVELLEVKG
jgi:FKBP-type peptidyl-prolyl cis-trans isomerase FkpA